MSTGTGIGWLDGGVCLAFAALTGYFLLRLGSRQPAVDHAFHTAMGLTMVIMFWPGGGAGRTWIALLGAAGLWSALVLAQARAPHPSASDSASPMATASAPQRTSGSTLSPSSPSSPSRRISYYAASGLVMLVAFGSSHSRTPAGTGLRLETTMAMTGGPQHETTEMALTDRHPIDASMLTTALHAAANWPLWPLVSVVFILYAGWLALADRRRRPLAERTCTALMAVGMAITAFSI
jgi:hypothetical protein